MNYQKYLKKLEKEDKGLGYELITIKAISEMSKIQNIRLKKYEPRECYHSLKLYLNGVPQYEQDIMLFLQRNFSIMHPFYKILEHFVVLHEDKNLIIQCKNYNKKVNDEKIDHDLTQIGLGGIMGHNLPILTMIVSNETSFLKKAHLKRKYHIKDVVNEEEFEENALENFGNILMTYKSVENMDEVTLDDIIEYSNNREGKLKIKKHKKYLGNLYLMKGWRKLKLFNVIHYSQKEKPRHVTISELPELKDIIRKTWQFLNPEYVYYLSNKGVTETAEKHLTRQNVDSYGLPEFIKIFKKGDSLKTKEFKVNLERDIGREISGNFEKKLLDLIDHKLDKGIHKYLTKERWNKAVEKFVYNKKKKSNFSVRK